MTKKETREIKIFWRIWSGLFLAAAFYYWLKKGSLNLAFISAAALALALGELIPEKTKIVYWLWRKFGDVSNVISTNVALFVIFYFFFVPVGAVAKLFGADWLGKKRADKPTYWIDRDEPVGSMRNQY